MPAWGTQLAGGKGLTTVQLPTVLEPGSLNITLHARAFVKSVPELDYTLSNGTGAVSFNFGFTKHVELGFTQIMYQDLNVSAAANGFLSMEQIPDDSYLRLKVGGYPLTLGNAFFKVGVLNQLRYRTGLVNGVYLEPYSGEGIEWEVDFLATYYTNPLYEDNAPAFHLNLGYLNHNDAGMGRSAFKATQEFVYGLGAVYPTRRFDFALETYGNLFTRYPDELTVYSRENSGWATPSIRYKMFYGMSANLGVDVLLFQQDDGTAYTTKTALPEGYPENYPPWRLVGSLSISPSTAFYRQPTFSKVSDPVNARKLLRERKSLFEWVVDEQEGVEYIDVELEKIKAERKKAELELEQLKKDLGNP
ncbi:MAG: hypothetical protein C4524_09730 [Candidatus Zixiibacteriota bacterium]|nr:MAG: hypothetical protein C4524_09730 [candidate division Zixibacteria bacterium]